MALASAGVSGQQEHVVGWLTFGMENLAVQLMFGFIHYSLHHDLAPFFKRLVANRACPFIEVCGCCLADNLPPEANNLPLMASSLQRIR